jgi:hypothetical protein
MRRFEPVYNVLEEAVPVVLVNAARDIKTK